VYQCTRTIRSELKTPRNHILYTYTHNLTAHIIIVDFVLKKTFRVLFLLSTGSTAPDYSRKICAYNIMYVYIIMYMQNVFMSLALT